VQNLLDENLVRRRMGEVSKTKKRPRGRFSSCRFLCRAIEVCRSSSHARNRLVAGKADRISELAHVRSSCLNGFGIAAVPASTIRHGQHEASAWLVHP